MLGEKCIKENHVYLHQTLILFFSVSSLAYLQVKIFDYFFFIGVENRKRDMFSALSGFKARGYVNQS